MYASVVFWLGLGAIARANPFNEYKEQYFALAAQNDSVEWLDQLVQGAPKFIEAALQVGQLLIKEPVGATVNDLSLPREGRMTFYQKGLPELEKVFEVITHGVNNLPGFDEVRNLIAAEIWRSEMSLTLELFHHLNDVLYDIQGTYGGLYAGLEKSIGHLRGGCGIPDCTWDRTNGWYDICRRAVHIDDRSTNFFIENLHRLVAPGCEEPTPHANGGGHYLANRIKDVVSKLANSSKVELYGGNKNWCLHKFMIRFPGYAPDVYQKFLSILATYIHNTLNIYGLCLPMAYFDEYQEKIPERKNRALEVIRTIGPQLYAGISEEMGDREDELIARGAVKYTKYVRYEIDDYPLPKPSDYLEVYGAVGNEIESFLGYWLPKQKYDTVVYYGGNGNQSQCVDQQDKNGFYHQSSGNMNYYVARTENKTLESVRGKIAEKDEDIKKVFMESDTDDLCERIGQLRKGISSLSESDNSITVIASKCAEQLSGSEKNYFPAVWSTEGAHIVSVNGVKNNETECHVLIFVP